jgi:hypothetical protein
VKTRERTARRVSAPGRMGFTPSAASETPRVRFVITFSQNNLFQTPNPRGARAPAGRGLCKLLAR